MAVLDPLGHVVDVEGLLGHQGDGGTARDARPRGDVAHVPSHELGHEDPVVALGGGVEPVQGVGRDLHGGLEPEGHLGSSDVVVDGLRHTDHRDAVVVEVVHHAHGALPADGHDGVEAEASDGLADQVRAVGSAVGLVA